MRVIFIALIGAAACATSPQAFSPTMTCQSDYDRCVRRESDPEGCEAYRERCVAAATAAREDATKKQRGFETFKREREDAK